MQPPAATDGDRRRGRGAALAHPLAAAIVALSACLVAFRGRTSIYRPDEDHLLRLLPFDNRFDARVGVIVAGVAALLVTVFARGKVGRRLRRGLGVVGSAAIALGGYYVVYSIRRDCSRWEGCDFWQVPSFLVDAVLLALASASLLVWAGREPGPRLRWFGGAAVVAPAIASAAWTYRATPVLHRYTGAQLAGVRLQGFFESNQEFVPDWSEENAARDAGQDEGRIPPAIPALPMQSSMMICGGDWRVVKFPDRDRCLPRRPMVKIAPDDIEVVTVAILHARGTPEMSFTLRPDAAKQFAAALRATGSFHFVLLNARGELIMDTPNPWPVPGPAFVITPGKKTADETERLVRLFLDLDRPPPAAAPPTTAPVKLDLSPEMRGPAPACAFVRIGFDRRAWPTNFSNQAFDSMTIGQADKFRAAALPGAPPRMYTQPGQTSMFALFDGETDDAVVARCRQTVAAYLPTAPHMPLVDQGSATHVNVACQPCR